MKIADAIVKTLENNDVKYTFGIPASTFGIILDSLNDSDIKYIITKNEAGATYSASRYAELSNKIGVCMLAGGVGVNNAINGIAEARRNKVPMIVICGDVKRSYRGKGALQEADNAKMVSSITKYAKNIVSEDEVIYELQKAMKIAMTPPMGPVLISIPFDIQSLEFNGEIDFNKIEVQTINCDDKMLSLAISEINKSERGVILVGRGTRGLREDIKYLSEKLKWPIISTPNAKGVINTDFPYYIGNYGFCSSDGAVEYIEKENIDCLLILGSSLGQTATRDYNDVLVKNKKVIRIDWDKQEFNKVFKEDISVYYDLKKAIPLIYDNVTDKDITFIKPLMNKPYIKDHTGISLRLLFEKMQEILPKNTCLVGDMGNFFNYYFKYMPISKHMDFQTSINYASMGSGVAGVIGSYLSNSHKNYAVIVGDGSFYMNGSEILTAKEYDMPITYFVINNSMFGLVKHGQKAVYGREFKAKIEFKYTNIASVAEAMGIEAVQITQLSQVDSLKELMSNRTSPLLVEIITDGTETFIDTDRLKKVSTRNV